MSKDINPNARSRFVDGNGFLSKYGMDVILKLYRTLNFTGESSAIDDIETVGLALVNNADIPTFDIITVSADFTTFKHSFINVTSQCVITLNPDPIDREQAIIHKNTGLTGDFIDVTDGAGTDRFTEDQTVLSYRYFVDLNQWVRGG